jgi:hypothetical protein
MIAVFEPRSGTISTSAFLAGYEDKSFSNIRAYFCGSTKHREGMIHQPDIYEIWRSMAGFF